MIEYWYMFFMCVGIATIAMAAGIGGATFFVPFLLLVLKVPIASAVAIGIFVEIFGFASGVYSYSRSKQIQYGLALKVLLFALVFVVLGVLLNRSLKPSVVAVVFAIAIMIFATQLLIGKEVAGGSCKQGRLDRIGKILAVTGGFLLGFMSTGLGEATEYQLFIRSKMKPAFSAGTTVFVVAVASLVATAAQAFYILHNGKFGSISTYRWLILYSVLGAVVGAQIGPILARRVNRAGFRKLVSGLLYLVAIATVAKVVLIK